MKTQIKKIIRRYCPNMPFLRKLLTAVKLQEIRRYRVKRAEIEAGERSWKQKKEIVEKYTRKWPSYTEELQKKLNEYLKKSGLIEEQTDLEVLQTRVLFDCFCYGFLPDEYFVYRLEKLSPKEKAGYISNRDKDIFSYRMNDIIEMDVFFDKYRTYQRFKSYYEREAIAVEKLCDFSCFENFIKDHPVFVRKNVMLSRGESVELIDMKQGGRTSRAVFDEMVARGKYIVEERVTQSAQMSRLNPASVNTVRCTTFFINGKIQIGPCFLKVGQGGSFVDNAAAGGILAGIDNKNGKLDTKGYDEFLKEYERHPETQIAFQGYQLPDWEGMVKLAEKLSLQIPDVRYISWDFAHTEKGWIIIEGNASGQFVVQQIVWKRGFKKDIQKLMKGTPARRI